MKKKKNRHEVQAKLIGDIFRLGHLLNMAQDKGKRKRFDMSLSMPDSYFEQLYVYIDDPTYDPIFLKEKGANEKLKAFRLRLVKELKKYPQYKHERLY